MPRFDVVHKERHRITAGSLLVTTLSIIGSLWGTVGSWLLTAILKPHTWTINDLVFLCTVNFVLWSATIVAEFFVYDSIQRNWRSSRDNGFSAARILLHFGVVFFAAIAIIVLVGSYEGEDAVPRFPDVAMVLRLAAIWFGIDHLVFHPLHQALHRVIPGVHAFHHCCFTPSFSTNFSIGVGDFAIEFGPPVVLGFLAFKTDLIGQRDPFVFTLYFVATLAHYIMDHDRLLQLEHFRHHTMLGCNYYIYNQSRQPRDPQEKLRGILLKTGDHPDRPMHPKDSGIKPRS